MTTPEASVKVEHVERAVPNDDLRGDVQVERIVDNRLELMGWAIGRRSQVRKIEILAKGNVVASTTTGLSRPDLAKAFPDEAVAPTAGYRVAIEAEGKGMSSLDVRAVLDDGTHAPLGQLRVEAPPRRWTDRFRLG